MGRVGVISFLLILEISPLLVSLVLEGDERDEEGDGDEDILCMRLEGGVMRIHTFNTLCHIITLIFIFLNS